MHSSIRPSRSRLFLALALVALVFFLFASIRSTEHQSQAYEEPLTEEAPSELERPPPPQPPPSKVKPAKNPPRPPRKVRNATSLLPDLPPDFPDPASLPAPSDFPQFLSRPDSKPPHINTFPAAWESRILPLNVFHLSRENDGPPTMAKRILADQPWSPPEGSFAQAWSPPDDFRLGDEKTGTLPRIQHTFEDDTEEVDAKKLTKARREIVRNAFLHAWEGYKSNAWGHDEVKPVSGEPSNPFLQWGATIIDSLDTLLVMGLQDEYLHARRHVRQLDFGIISGINWAKGPAELGPNHSVTIHAFETIIRYLGGLLGAYDLSGDKLLLKRAEELGKIVLPIFDTSSGVPMSRLNPKSPESLYGGHSIQLAEAGTLLLEYTRLAQLTGNQTYFNLAQRGMDYLDQVVIPKSPFKPMLPTIFSTENPRMAGTYSFGGMADSYYEYLLKQHILLRGKVPRYGQLYSSTMDKASETIIQNVKVVPGKQLTIIGEIKGGRYRPVMEHLSCFVGGLMALGSKVLTHRSRDLFYGKRISQTCYYLGSSTASGMQPERADFFLPDDPKRHELVIDIDTDEEVYLPRGSPVGTKSIHKHYLSRPESIESIWYMYRITGDHRYQDQGWRMFTDWISKTQTTYGFSAVTNTKDEYPELSDNMESFVLAETFKYYFLLFSEPDDLSLDDYVFSTEAHPFIHNPRRKPGFSNLMDLGRISKKERDGPIGLGSDVQKFAAWELLTSLGLIRDDEGK